MAVRSSRTHAHHSRRRLIPSSFWPRFRCVRASCVRVLASLHACVRVCARRCTRAARARVGTASRRFAAGRRVLVELRVCLCARFVGCSRVSATLTPAQPAAAAVNWNGNRLGVHADVGVVCLWVTRQPSWRSTPPRNSPTGDGWHARASRDLPPASCLLRFAVCPVCLPAGRMPMAGGWGIVRR